ncbi:unnamed protein product [Callosobruchus maculatus]|uniref:Peptidase C1A papain C-terminal domain-containing protein n=1 Tax=Callosobruchus maculatus TaxID=64391 RepID=A0A653DBU5_CALMS|nr:unnamed protein product [Callosobruchus maculatus]
MHCKKHYIAPKCKKECDKGSQLKYEKDKHYGKKAYTITSGDERQIQLEIIKNGPVVATFTAYTDLITYKHGVYRLHDDGSPMGGHAVRMIGWGIENGTHPYWLITNSWGEHYGIKGLLKIRRGNNECGIEEHIIAGLP